MSSRTLLQFDTSKTLLSCGKCGIEFAVPTSWRDDRRHDHRTWYCPNGHPRHFPGESEVERERRLREEAERSATWAQNRADSANRRAEHAERSASSYKGHLTRTKRRVASGVCPCCNRSFKNLAQHMKGQHPGYADE